MSILKYAGYAAFFFASFLVSLYLTFPFDTVKDKLLVAASKAAGAKITAKTLEPSWITGVVATGVKYEKPGGAPIEIDELNARVALLPLLTGDLGVSASLPIAKGTVGADVVTAGDEIDIDATIAGVELALVPGFADAVGLPVGGKVDASVKLHLDTKTPKNSAGEINLAGSGIEILEGGKMSGFPIPPLAIGDLEWKVPIEEGVVKVTKQEVKGENVELELDGEVALVSPFDRSQLKLLVSFRPTPAFLKKEPILNALLNNIARAKGTDGFYTYALNGSVKQPRFSPSRRR
jgi:type II secretion system protein N